MDNLVLKLRILFRAESTIRSARIRLATRQATLASIGLVLALLALGALNLGIYLSLEPLLGSANAAFGLAAGNGVLALILVITAGRLKPGSEVAMAEEIRDMAMNELSADVDRLGTEIQRVRSDVSQINAGFRGALKGDLMGLATLAPLVGTGASSLKKRKK